jgi:hypothetical protein
MQICGAASKNRKLSRQGCSAFRRFSFGTKKTGKGKANWRRLAVSAGNNSSTSIVQTKKWPPQRKRPLLCRETDLANYLLRKRRAIPRAPRAAPRSITVVPPSGVVTPPGQQNTSMWESAPVLGTSRVKVPLVPSSAETV